MMEQMLKLCMFLLRVKLTFLEDTVMLIVYKQCGFFGFFLSLGSYTVTDKNILIEAAL